MFGKPQDGFAGEWLGCCEDGVQRINHLSVLVCIFCPRYIRLDAVLYVTLGLGGRITRPHLHRTNPDVAENQRNDLRIGHLNEGCDAVRRDAMRCDVNAIPMPVSTHRTKRTRRTRRDGFHWPQLRAERVTHVLHTYQRSLNIHLHHQHHHRRLCFSNQTECKSPTHKESEESEERKAQAHVRRYRL